MYQYKRNIIILLSVLISFFVIVILLFPKFFKEKESQIKLPNDIRWVVESDEYKMLASQVYKNATQYILTNYDKSKKNAIVMDLDETILDNSLYQVENFQSGKTFNMESWAKWVEREEALLVPGSKDFINVVRDLNIQLIFLSNRMDSRLENTKNNLKELGLYNDNDIYLLRLDKEDKKHIRRNEIYNSINRMEGYPKFNILAYIGDAKGDFPKGKNTLSFILPNPMYGKW